MDFDSAYNVVVVGYIGNFENPLNLGEEEVGHLAGRIVSMQRDVSVEEIDQIAVKMFPRVARVNDGGTSAPQNPTQKSPRSQQKQSQKECLQIIAYFFEHEYWQRVVPFAPPPIKKDGTMGSAINYQIFFNFLGAETQLGSGPVVIAHDTLSNIAVTLWNRGLLERYPEPPKVVEKIVQAPAPTPKELNDRRVRMERSLQDRDSSPIRGASEQPKALVTPVLSERAKSQRNAKAVEDNRIVNEALDRISRFTGHSHARTQSGRLAAREVLTQALDNGASAKDALAAVLATLDSLAGNSSIR